MKFFDAMNKFGRGQVAEANQQFALLSQDLKELFASEDTIDVNQDSAADQNQTESFIEVRPLSEGSQYESDSESMLENTAPKARRGVIRGVAKIAADLVLATVEIVGTLVIAVPKYALGYTAMALSGDLFAAIKAAALKTAQAIRNTAAIIGESIAKVALRMKELSLTALNSVAAFFRQVGVVIADFAVKSAQAIKVAAQNFARFVEKSAKVVWNGIKIAANEVGKLAVRAAKSTFVVLKGVGNLAVKSVVAAYTLAKAATVLTGALVVESGAADLLAMVGRNVAKFNVSAAQALGYVVDGLQSLGQSFVKAGNILINRAPRPVVSPLSSNDLEGAEVTPTVEAPAESWASYLPRQTKSVNSAITTVANGIYNMFDARAKQGYSVLNQNGLSAFELDNEGLGVNSTSTIRASANRV